MVTFCYVFQLLIIRRIYKSIPFARRWNPYTIVDLSNIVGVGYKTIDLARGRKRPTEKRCSDCDGYRKYGIADSCDCGICHLICFSRADSDDDILCRTGSDSGGPGGCRHHQQRK